MDFDLLWINCSVVADHKLHHGRLFASNFIYYLIMVSATANDVSEFGFGEDAAVAVCVLFWGPIFKTS